MREYNATPVGVEQPVSDVAVAEVDENGEFVEVSG